MTTRNTLPNGATILARDVGAPTTWIVLAWYGGHQPYVTWSVDADGHADSGHYFSSIASAENDYIMRCRRGF